MASNGHIDTQPLIGKVKMLINTQLKEVLKREQLPVSGVKAILQERIIARKCAVRPVDNKLPLDMSPI